MVSDFFLLFFFFFFFFFCFFFIADDARDVISFTRGRRIVEIFARRWNEPNYEAENMTIKDTDTRVLNDAFLSFVLCFWKITFGNRQENELRDGIYQNEDINMFVRVGSIVDRCVIFLQCRINCIFIKLCIIPINTQVEIILHIKLQ